MGQMSDIVRRANIIDEEDEGLVRWVALQLIDGKKESEIRRMLSENSLFQSALSPEAWNRLMLLGITQAESMRSLVVSRAELASTDYLRLDSYQRRKNNIERLERIIEKAESQADSVSKLNSVSFMVGGLMKAQESMDKFSGAQEAAPAVQINIGYDPLDQFRNVIQKEATTIIEIEPVESSDEEE